MAKKTEIEQAKTLLLSKGYRIAPPQYPMLFEPAVGILVPGDACHGPFDLKWLKRIFRLFKEAGYRVPDPVQLGKILFSPAPDWVVDVCYGTGRHLPPEEFQRRLENLVAVNTALSATPKSKHP